MAGAKKKLVIKELKVADLTDYENNPRLNDAAVPKMAALIEKFGFRVPILVKDGVIVDGHLRIKAARSLKLETVPTIDVGDLSEADEKALRISMNKSSEWAEWDIGLLGAEMKAIMEGGVELDITGFGTSEANALIKKLSAPPTPAPIIPKNKDADAGTPALPDYVSLTFHMAASNRDKVMAALTNLQTEEGLTNTSQALVLLATKGTA